MSDETTTETSPETVIQTEAPAPRRRSAPKVEETVVAVLPEDEPVKLSAQTLLEMEAGRKVLSRL